MLRILALLLAFTTILPAQLPVAKTNELQETYNFADLLNENVSVSWHTVAVSPKQKSTLLQNFKFKKNLPDTLVYGKVSGPSSISYIWLDSAPSKQMWFTYLLGIDKNGAINRIEILHYPETHGGQISHPGFRKQFYGISNPKKLRFGRKIQSISGATISSRNLTKAIRDLLYLHSFLKEQQLLN